MCRERDSNPPNLGKVVLYQLSYCRMKRFLRVQRYIIFFKWRRKTGKKCCLAIELS